jgi:hypothetical protein
VSRRLLAAGLASTLLLASACDMPRFEGPQIQNPPVNFLLQAESYQQRRLFPERNLAFHTAWVHMDIGGVSAIYVNGFAGAMTLDDVLSGAEGIRTAEPDPDAVFGEVEALTIDGREAFGWSERIASTRRGLVDVRYRAVIPYDSITYVVAFVSDEPSLKRVAPDSLRVVVASFAVGATTWNLPLIVILLGGALLLFSMVQRRQQERRLRHRSINLVQFKKDEPDEGSGEPGTTPSKPPEPGDDD